MMVDATKDAYLEPCGVQIRGHMAESEESLVNADAIPPDPQ